MLAEVVGYRGTRDEALLTIACDRATIFAKVVVIPEGFRLSIGDQHSAPYGSEDAAIQAACRYAERMVLGAGL